MDASSELGSGLPSNQAEPGTKLSSHDPSHPGAGEDDNKFQTAIAAWRKISLSTLMPDLDKVASDVVNYQRDSLVQRKDLAQKTKDFRKLEDTAKLSEIKGLLKAYQGFIDLLTNQSKSTSAAFLQVYSSLSEAPDPYPLLEASVEALVLSEDTLPKVTEENRHLQKTVAKLSTQLEETERRLEAERRARKALEDDQQAKSAAVESSWAAVLGEKQDNWDAKERSLEEKVESQERLLKELKASYEVSQRLDQAENEHHDGRGGASAAELEMVSVDLERTALRLAEVEARNEQLRLELAQQTSQSQAAPHSTAVEDDPVFLRVQSEASSLRRKLDAVKMEKTTEQRAWEAKLRGFEREAAQLKDERDALREKMEAWSDYTEVKRELDMLKSIEFATGDDDELDQDVDAHTSDGTARGPRVPNGAMASSKADTLEQLLLARNRKLGDELTLLRVSHNELQGRLEDLQTELARTTSDLDQSRHLNAQLENDLLKVQQDASNAMPSFGLSVAATHNSRSPHASVTGGRRFRTSPTSSIISGFDPMNSSSASHDAMRGSEGSGGAGSGSGILPMLTAQRDRFKQRNTQLEDELSKTYQTVTSLRQEIAALQKDNLSLYEKTRYASSFHRGPAATTSSGYGVTPGAHANPSAIPISSTTSSASSVDRYRSAYEASISPFAAFRVHESARAYRRMSLPERVVFSTMRVVLATRTSRNLFAAYCLALHGLVIIQLYWVATTDLERHHTRMGEAAVGPR